MKEAGDHVWYIYGPEGEISALLLQNRQSLFPVFSKNAIIPQLHFLKRFFIKIPVHAVQGLMEDAELLETLMEDLNYYATERVYYALMSLDGEPRSESLRAGPMELVLRPPLPGDEEDLFGLQSAYEKEEVLPRNAAFNPAVCRYNLSNILSSERVLVAELDHQVVGKINTSAESFTRYQIGGVYVRPDCRGRGIAEKMTASFARDLVAGGKGVTLFVKKNNEAAMKVYRRAGFSVLADYRISYF
jgi:GNAT superfamily N-acetyltransferase